MTIRQQIANRELPRYRISRLMDRRGCRAEYILEDVLAQVAVSIGWDYATIRGECRRLNREWLRG